MERVCFQRFYSNNIIAERPIINCGTPFFRSVSRKLYAGKRAAPCLREKSAVFHADFRFFPEIRLKKRSRRAKLIIFLLMAVPEL